MLANARQHGFHGIGIQIAGTCDTFERHVVDVATGQAGNLRHAGLCAGRCQEKYEVHVAGAQPCCEVFALFRRVINNQHTVDAGV